MSKQPNNSLDANDLRKLKRSELMEIMLAQSEEIDRLRAELAAKDAELESRRIAIQDSGSIAEASLRLTKVFEEAQRAADLYLDNVRSSAGVAPSAGQQGQPSPRESVPEVDPESTSTLPRRRARRQSSSVLEAPRTARHFA